MKSVLVTRPSPDGEKTCKRLIASGADAFHLPVMTIKTHKVPAPDEMPAALAFTSANGVRAYAAQEWALPLPAYCVGKATAAAAQDARFPVLGMAEGNVESLADLMGRTPVLGKILHLRGAAAKGDLVHDLLSKGLPAQGLILYTAEPLQVLPDPIKSRLCEDHLGVAFFSPRTVQLFSQLIAQHDLEGFMTQHQALCLSEAVAEAASELRFCHVHAANAPNETSFVDMVISLRT